MKTLIKILTISILVLITSSSVFTLPAVNLTKGKNVLILNVSSPFYVKTLVKLNPKIDVISYKEGNKTIGYVNVFGGIGENFIIQKNREYEIIVKENTTLVLP